MATLTTRPTGWTVLYQNTNVAGAEDTSYLAAPTTAYAINGIDADAFDTLKNNAGGKNSYYNNIEIIVTHNHATDADETSSVLELYGANDSGPRYPIASIACTGGKAEVVAGTDTTTWVDTMVVTSYHSKTITVTDSATDRVARVTLDITGIRRIEGLFTGGGSTSVITTAYVRGF